MAITDLKSTTTLAGTAANSNEPPDDNNEAELFAVPGLLTEEEYRADKSGTLEGDEKKRVSDLVYAAVALKMRDFPFEEIFGNNLDREMEEAWKSGKDLREADLHELIDMMREVQTTFLSVSKYTSRLRRASYPRDAEVVDDLIGVLHALVLAMSFTRKAFTDVIEKAAEDKAKAA